MHAHWLLFDEIGEMLNLATRKRLALAENGFAQARATNEAMVEKALDFKGGNQVHDMGCALARAAFARLQNVDDLWDVAHRL